MCSGLFVDTNCTLFASKGDSECLIVLRQEQVLAIRDNEETS